MSEPVGSTAIAFGDLKAGPVPWEASETKIAIDGHAITEVTRHHAPLTTGCIDVEDAIENASKIERRSSGSTGLPLGFREQQLQNMPLLIAHARCIMGCGAHC
jgi:hypothetical protein